LKSVYFQKIIVYYSFVSACISVVVIYKECIWISKNKKCDLEICNL